MNEEFSFKDILTIINGDITASIILRFTNVIPTVNEDGSFTVKPNKWTLHSKIILNPKDTINLNERIETTIGRAIINKLLKIDPFGDYFKYDNNPIFINEFIDEATSHLLKGTITTEQMIKLFNNTVWLTRFSDMVLPSLSKNILVTPKSTVELKKKLTEENKKMIENGDVAYVDKVEKPVLNDIIKNIKNDPSFMLYEVGKPSIGNNLKQSIGTFSPIYNSAKGKFDIPDGNLMTGHNPSLYDGIANMNIAGTYARNIATQQGGSSTKTIYNSMSNIKAGPVDSDCGTKKYKEVYLTKNNVFLYIWNYMVEGNRLILLTPDNNEQYLNKICYFRSALYCMYENRFEICNKCAGEIPYKTGLLSIGLLCSRLPFQMTKASLKQFHDSTVNLTNINPFEYMKIEK